MVLPRVRFRDAPHLGVNAYELQVFGVPAGKGEDSEREIARAAGVQHSHTTSAFPSTRGGIIGSGYNYPSRINLEISPECAASWQA